MRTNPKMGRTKHTISDLQKSGKNVELSWIHGHAGSSENETADAKTKKTS